jgi:GT2 family glycosyltransferase
LSDLRPLVVIPTYMTQDSDAALLEACLRSIWATEGDRVEVLVVDDGSPDHALVTSLEAWSATAAFEVVAKEVNEGFSRTVNVGLQRALEENRDAILVNADIEFMGPGWLDAMRNQRRLDRDAPAEVVGGLLCYPNGTIQHAGIYFSLLSRVFDHLHKHGPMNLPEALVPRACPVTGAVQFIRHSTLCVVGLYDPEFRMSWEDVDYCLRVFLAGGQCVYSPNVRAWHHEMVFRGRQTPKLQRWHLESFYRLMTKYANVNFAALVPAL